MAVVLRTFTKLMKAFRQSNANFSWRIRPSPSLFDCRDGILVIGDEKIYVNKMVGRNTHFRKIHYKYVKDLASQSPYFEKLFYGGFMEQSMKEIPIGGVEFEVVDFLCNLH